MKNLCMTYCKIIPSIAGIDFEIEEISSMYLVGHFLFQECLL